MSLTLDNGPRRGVVTVPGSKSHLHRLLIANFLAGDRSFGVCEGDNDDIAATKRCLAALSSGEPEPVLDCGESGSTLRFLTPVAAALGRRARYLRRGRLALRPFREYATLEPGVHELPGDVSSQFVTGLLFALPLLKGDSEIRFTSGLESRGYVDMTLRVLRDAGIEIGETADGFRVPGCQKYLPVAAKAEGDWSGAAFWYGMNALGSEIDIRGLEADASAGGTVRAASAQPDRAIASLCEELPTEVEVSQFPDLFPVLSVVAAGTPRTTAFTGIARLRLKECDRVETMREMLGTLGVNADVDAESFIVKGIAGRFRGGEVRTFGDHRIAMAAAVAATRAGRPLTIDNPFCCSKSYPGFFETFASLPRLHR